MKNDCQADHEEYLMNLLDEFLDVARKPVTYGEILKKRDHRKIIGYFCSYAPEELIYAAGAHPFRMFSTGKNIQLADAHFQSYCCSLVRGSLEGALTGRFDFLDGILFPHTCDSIQRLSDIWRMNVKGHAHFDFVLPVKLDTPSAQDYLADVLRKCRNDLEVGLNTSISNDSLKKAIHIYNRIREHLKEIYKIKSAYPGIIKGNELFSIVKASMIMDRDRLLELLPLVIENFKTKMDSTPSMNNKRLILTGGICNHPDIYEIIEGAGGTVVGDDLCTGSRYFDSLTAETIDPITALAERYIRRHPCPAKHSGLFTRAEHIVATVRKENAQGVIFLFLKFCDPHSFDYPYIKEMLDRQNIPSIKIELEDQLPSEGQLQTRLETFVQMLS